VRAPIVIVLAAGEGTRMKSQTPKVLHEIAGRSLLGHVIEAASTIEPEHLVVVIGHGDPMITAKTYALVLDMQAIEASAVFTKAMG
jgi:bifunctional UDP-N-acetylglucosamine pyrophosphorylase / glucosamine-1-phosphate N-acetyltransferase